MVDSVNSNCPEDPCHLCFTETRIQVEFSSKNFDLAEKAIKIAGYTPTVNEPGSISFFAKYSRVTIRDGEIELIDDRDQPSLNEVKQQYKRELIKEVARRNKQYGWVLKQISKNHFRLRKW